MKEYVIFGSGDYGQMLLDYLGADAVECFLDNNKDKWGEEISGIEICSPEASFDLISDKKIIVGVSKQYEEEIKSQLSANGITNVIGMQSFMKEIVKQRTQNSGKNHEIYNKAIKWIKNNTVDGKGIINDSALPLPYPEVTGYYIPSILSWGYRDLAVSYAKWLLSIQKPEGSWYDTKDVAPYVFDTGQILKGLIAIRELLPEVDKHIISGCDYMLSNIDSTGRLSTPNTDEWNERMCSELIHLYCLSPLKEAGEIFGRHDYIEAAKKVLGFYINNSKDKILDFHLLSHFYSYVVEALIDLGEVDLAKEALKNIEKYQKEDGSVPAYKDVNYVCSTGLFQLAICWYRTGNTERGNKAFKYACSLQNSSGGWYGAYLHPDHMDEEIDYFAFSEISWANKYFLDALYYRNLAEFEGYADNFLSSFEEDRDLFEKIKKEVETCGGGDKSLSILDAGCGKGRYLRGLKDAHPQNKYYGIDISPNVMKYVNDNDIILTQGSLTNIPYPDNTFDLVFTCEALEHAIDIRSAVRELFRVTTSGGKVVIIDKDDEKKGDIVTGEWECWFKEDDLKKLMEECGGKVSIYKNFKWNKTETTDLFIAWVGVKE